MTQLKSIQKNRYERAIGALVNLSEFFSKSEGVDNLYKNTTQALFNLIKNKGKKDEYFKEGNAFEKLKFLVGDKVKKKDKDASLVRLYNSKKKKEELKLGADFITWNESINDFYYLLKYAKKNNRIEEDLEFIPSSITGDEKKYMEEAGKRLKELESKKS